MAVNICGSVEVFIQSLNLPKNVALVLFKSDLDCKEFFESFYGRNRYVVDDLLDYREFKIENSDMTLEKFTELCYISNTRDVFESTFYQSFSLDDMLLIEKAITSGKTSLETIYLGFEKNPNKNIMKYVL
jgi:hypothetical protein